MTIIGLDIGGANLKAATTGGVAVSRAFDLWKTPERLAEELEDLLGELPVGSAFAVTMTGELADCFETKAEGVARILQAVMQIARATPVHVWQTTGRFVSPDEAIGHPLRTAAANWHALATWVAGEFDVQSGLLIDVGSTTTDIIPLRGGAPTPDGLTDSARLAGGELVYTGVRRTPLCAVAATVPFRGGFCPLAAEWFATTLDVYVTLGQIPEDATDCHTANGRPATKAAAHDRLARMLCCDRSEFHGSDARKMARFLADIQQQTCRSALQRVITRLTQPCETIVLSGSGTFFARRLTEDLPNCRVVHLTEQLSPATATAACAFAAAQLRATGRTRATRELGATQRR